ncbi:MAG: hypothetical protein QXN83_10290 [Nitrososphaerales archaeon]
MIESEWHGEFDCKPIKEDFKCAVKVTSVKAAAFSESWVIKDKQTNDLPNHEQRHFDIV